MVSFLALTIPPRPSLCSKTFSSCLQIRAHRYATCSWKLGFHPSIHLTRRNHCAILRWWYSSLNIGTNLMPKLGNSLRRWHCMCRQNCLSNHWTDPPIHSMRSEIFGQVKWFARRKERESLTDALVWFSALANLCGLVNMPTQARGHELAHAFTTADSRQYTHLLSRPCISSCPPALSRNFLNANK